MNVFISRLVVWLHVIVNTAERSFTSDSSVSIKSLLLLYYLIRSILLLGGSISIISLEARSNDLLYTCPNHFNQSPIHLRMCAFNFFERL